jgi:hypothetical protein
MCGRRRALNPQADCAQPLPLRDRKAVLGPAPCFIRNSAELTAKRQSVIAVTAPLTGTP